MSLALSPAKTGLAWPDWSDRVVAVLATGHSVRLIDVSRLNRPGIATFAIKGSIEKAPWAEAVYGCDAPWWKHVRGLPDYRGLKLAYAPKACDQFGCRKVGIEVQKDELLTDAVGVVGSGGNSGFQATNLAVQFGARRIVLIGFDCQGPHWYGRNNWHGGNNPDVGSFRRWIAAWTRSAPVLKKLDVEVVNASPVSAITAFPKAGLAETLERWGV